MKTGSIALIPVNIPPEALFYWPVGMYPGASKAVIRVRADSGLTGWARRRPGTALP